MTRADCIEQAKEYFFDRICDGLKNCDAVDMKSIRMLGDVLHLPEKCDRGFSVALTIDEVKNSVGAGWIEENCQDPDDPDYIGDVRPCIWADGFIFDAENEEYEIETGDPEWYYDHWHSGFRLWADGKKPDMEQRKARKWKS